MTMRHKNPALIHSSAPYSSLFMRRFLSKRGAIVLAAAISLSLASCGRRGPLEPPPGAPTSNVPLTGTPGDYEATANPGELAGQNTANSNGAATPGQAGGKQAAPPVRKPFVLDPLL
jgi:predicted small lipoprotein YifL